MEQMTADPFGEVLRRFRKRRRLSLQTLADRLGMHRITISRWERGDFLPGSKTMVLELARHLTLNDQETRLLLEASLTALSPYWSVPFPRNVLFTGREETLEALHQGLCVHQTIALTQSYALHGLGGIGKTHVAIEYAYRHALEYTAVFWIEAESLERIIASFLVIAELLHLSPGPQADHQQIVSAVQRWLSTHRQWLLIWDNVEDLKLLQSFLPPARQGAILLTTRRQTLGTLAQQIEVETMGMAEATLFLLRRARLLASEDALDQASHAHLAAAEAIAIAMDFLPLALDQAGAYIEEIGCSLSTYLELYRAHRQELLQRRGQGPTDHPEPVATTWSLSFAQIEQANPAAAEVLRLCAFLEPDTIPEELLSEGHAHLGPVLGPTARDAFQLNAAFEELRRFSLVQRDSERNMLRIHRLVQAILKSALKTEEQRQWAERAVRTTNAVFPHVVEVDTWQEGQRYLSQAQMCTVLIQTYTFAFPEAGSLLSRTAEYLKDRGLYEQAEPLFQQAISFWEQALEPDHPDMAVVLRQFAELCGAYGRYEQAESLCQRAVHILENSLGPEHPEVASTLDQLAVLYRMQGKYEQASPLFQRSLQILEQTLGPDHLDVAQTLNGFASLLIAQGKYEQAGPLFQRALQIWEQTLGPEHPEVARALSNLAVISYEQEKYEQAEPMFRQVLQLWEQALGPEHPNVALALNNLADDLSQLGKDEQAEPLYQRGLRICERVLGSDHPLTAALLNGLASLSSRQHTYEQALPLYKRALAIREQRLGQDHPETAQTLHDFAACLQQQGSLDEAIALAQRALSIQEQRLEDAHPKTVATRALYEQLLQDQAWKLHTEEHPETPRGESHSEKATPLPKAVNASPSDFKS